MSEQRRELAQNLIAARESTFRQIARELHDEFGQIVTAIGTMLKRARRHLPEDSPLHADLRETGEIAQSTLENVRSLSQTLHPSILEELGLDSTIEWYLSTVEKQLDITVSYARAAPPCRVDSTIAIHVYRVLQEALSNVARHSGAGRAWVRLRFAGRALELEVEDHGTGMVAGAGRAASASSRCGSAPSWSAARSSFSDLAMGVPGAPAPAAERLGGRMTKITVLLADDHALVRRGFRRLLEDDPDIVVVGEATDGDEAIRQATSLKPGVVVMDCAMPRHERTRRDARDPASLPDTAILMLSMHSEETLVRQALEAGARGYVLKDALDLDLAGAVKRVAAGETRARSDGVATAPAAKGERSTV